MSFIFLYTIVLLYIGICSYLGWLGYKHTHSSTDFMVAGRRTNPYIMSLSYGATFISTSAIIGFGGAAAVFGTGLIWLTFLNIFLGIFVAFALFGRATRRIGSNLDARTFPELLGRRYQSKFIQLFSGLVIFIVMPLYTAAVMIGGANILAEIFQIAVAPALVIFSVIVAMYVISGGLKSVMYTDAFQAVVMFFVMTAFLLLTFAHLGGPFVAFEKLSSLAPEAIKIFGARGHQGWHAMPVGGSPLWWELVTTIVLGVGIGVLAQPQLAVRFMTVKDGRSLNRAIGIGGVFILAMTGFAFTVGALTNVYFFEQGGQISFLAAGKAVDKIIPMYIAAAMPKAFGAVFLVGMLAAGMSTLSSQIHTMGTALGHDVYRTAFGGDREKSLAVNRIAMFITILGSTILAWYLPILLEKQGVEIIARGTSIFFGLCAAAFLPLYILGLFTRWVTRQGAIAGMIAGTATSFFWIAFVNAKSAAALGLAKGLFGAETLIASQPWPVVDPVVIGLPISFAVTILVSLFTKKTPAEHLALCFEGKGATSHPVPTIDEVLDPEAEEKNGKG
jgi:SSS family solute:Na+ symporter